MGSKTSADRRQGIRVATVTFSDSRQPADDRSGQLMGELLRQAGYSVVGHQIVREQPAEIRAALSELCADENVDAIVTSGGTGIAPRDHTVETLNELLSKRLEGFGEAFRRLSWDEIGPRAVLSRAVAGVVDRTFVACLPGSTGAVRTAITAVLAPILEHAVELTQGQVQHGCHRSAAVLDSVVRPAPPSANSLGSDGNDGNEA